jgi:hypothetical protein
VAHAVVANPAAENPTAESPAGKNAVDETVGLQPQPRRDSNATQQISPASSAAVSAAPADGPAGLPADPLDAWRRGAEAVGGLAADFADLASAAVWRDEVLEIIMPASAGNAASFLRRPEIAEQLTRALAELAGRAVRHKLVIDASRGPANPSQESDNRSAAAAERGRPAMSQAAMLRDAAEHPLVAHVRTLFDAAVRKVEPPRPRPAAAVQPATVQAVGATAHVAAAGAVVEDDERHAAPTDSEEAAGYGGIDG